MLVSEIQLLCLLFPTMLNFTITTMKTFQSSSRLWCYLNIFNILTFNHRKDIVTCFVETLMIFASKY